MSVCPSVWLTELCAPQRRERTKKRQMKVIPMLLETVKKFEMKTSQTEPKKKQQQNLTRTCALAHTKANFDLKASAFAYFETDEVWGEKQHHFHLT